MGVIEEVENVLTIWKERVLDLVHYKHARGVGTHDCEWFYGGYQ